FQKAYAAGEFDAYTIGWIADFPDADNCPPAPRAPSTAADGRVLFHAPPGVVVLGRGGAPAGGPEGGEALFRGAGEPWYAGPSAAEAPLDAARTRRRHRARPLGLLTPVAAHRADGPRPGRDQCVRAYAAGSLL
ncbi:hypothetical protein, partial [Streptomyces sp. NPDC001436]